MDFLQTKLKFDLKIDQNNFANSIATISNFFQEITDFYDKYNDINNIDIISKVFVAIFVYDNSKTEECYWE